MNEQDASALLEEMERRKARLLEEAAAVERDMAAFAQLAAKYNVPIGTPGSPVPPASESDHPVQSALFSNGASVITAADLADRYQTDKRSTFHTIGFRTRENYKNLLKALLQECGNEKLSDWKAHRIQRLYDSWANRDRKPMGRGIIGMCRVLLNFGTTVLEHPECERLSVVLSKMRFEMTKPRSEQLTEAHAIGIRKQAHRFGWASIALAQAFQFDCGLRQKDVIGEWLPLSEQGVSDIHKNGKKWVGGVRWEEIDDALILRKAGDEIDLTKAPMVREELGIAWPDIGYQGRDALPPKGPVIVSEGTIAPWTSFEFRRQWRKFADAAGVPKNVKNMDSRPRSTNEVRSASAASGRAAR